MTKWRIPSATVNAHFYRTVKHGRVKRGRVGSSGRVRSRRRRSRYNVSHIEALRDAVPVCSSEMRDTVRQIPLPAPRQASDNRRLGSPRFLFPPPLSLRVDLSLLPLRGPLRLPASSATEFSRSLRRKWMPSDLFELVSVIDCTRVRRLRFLKNWNVFRTRKLGYADCVIGAKDTVGSWLGSKDAVKRAPYEFL